MRSISLVCDVSINTVAKMLADAGKVCMAFHDENVRSVTANRVQVDEIWSFTYAKQKNVQAAKAAPDGAGDTWTWTAIDADTKLIAAWFVGGRDAECANAFISDLASRLANRVQLTSDGHKAYLEAVEGAFGADVDYAQLVKMFGSAPENMKGKYSPAECGFSKKFESHVHMVALYTVFYNWTRIHKTLRVTPAMGAGLTDRMWSMEDVVALMDAVAPKSGRPKTYQKRAA